MNFNKLIQYISKKVEEIPRSENYNQDTFMWSRGFKKGAEYVLKLIKSFKE